jgi:hypothetical protein
MIQLFQQRDECQDTWQNAFVKLLPDIEGRLRSTFCRLDEEACDEAIEEGIVHAMFSFIRLYNKGRADTVSASNLSWFAALQVKRGRPAAGRMNGNEPLSRYAQIGKRVQVERLQGNWIHLLVEDKRASVADTVAARIDITTWLASLSKRLRSIAKDMAFGVSTREIATKHGVTAGRVSQLRRSLEKSWAVFQKETAPILA